MHQESGLIGVLTILLILVGTVATAACLTAWFLWQENKRVTKINKLLKQQIDYQA